MLLYRFRHNLGSSLWLVPLLCVLGGIVLALGTTAVDRYFGYGLIPQSVTGNPNAAQTILNMIATSMVTLTSITLTLTLVAVQLAMGQFSPRIVRALLSDHRTQLSIGLFAATFTTPAKSLGSADSSTPPGTSCATTWTTFTQSIIPGPLRTAKTSGS